MTGKQLSEDHRVILTKLLQLPKLTNREIAWVINVDQRTVQRRRREFVETGELKKHKDVSMNAEKLKPYQLEKLVEWHKDHPDALIEDMQLFLQKHFNLKLCHTTVSRRLKEVYGTHMRNGRCARLRARKEREEQGLTYAMEIEQSVVDNIPPAPAPELYHDQRQLAPIQQLLEPHNEALQHQALPNDAPQNQAPQHQAAQYQAPQPQAPQYQAPQRHALRDDQESTPYYVAAGQQHQIS